MPVPNDLSCKIGDFCEDFPAAAPPLMMKKHFILVIPPIGNLDVALLFIMGKVSSYSTYLNYPHK